MTELAARATFCLSIGYDGLGYVTADMKTLDVGLDPQGPFWPPNAATVNAGTYPIARKLYMYTAGEPQGELKAYLEWILSPEAQQIVQDLGFVPVSAP